MKYIVKAINAYLKEKAPEEEAFETIYNDLFPDDDFEGLVSRHEAGQANVTTYIDGSSEGTFSVAYWCRNTDASVCRELLEKVMNLLDEAFITSSAGLEITVNAVTTPQFVSVDEKGRSIYTCSVSADFYRD